MIVRVAYLLLLQDAIENANMLLEYHLKHLKQVEQLKAEKLEIDQQLRTFHHSGQREAGLAGQYDSEVRGGGGWRGDRGRARGGRARGGYRGRNYGGFRGRGRGRGGEDFMRGRGRGMSDRREDRSHYREEERENSVSREKKKESQTERETSQGGPGDRKSQPKESGETGGAKPQRQTVPRKGKEGGEGAKPFNGTPPATASATKDTNGTPATKKIDDEKVNNSRRK